MSELVPDPPVQVLIVDDHDVVHWGLQVLLARLDWVAGCRSARTGEEARALARELAPDVALIDLFVGQESGPQICEALHLIVPGLRALLISGSGQISSGAALACGASGFISKNWRAAAIVEAVRTVGLGQSLFDGSAEADGVRVAGPGLSRREGEVLALLATGATNQEIAARLHLSTHTVKEYVSGLYRKLEVRNRAEAVQRALSLGLTA
ncbi:MAG TPA: response regulator transcription factor [Solirubrobacteraceae bacterium]|nr:response regulator transcription factor [Solirubrobacteraceae bacterium]